MRVAVIGSTGQLGQDLMRVFGEEAVGFAHEDLDVTDEESVVAALRSVEPNWVLNTAAFHRVDGSGRRRERRGVLLVGLRLWGPG